MRDRSRGEAGFRSERGDAGLPLLLITPALLIIVLHLVNASQQLYERREAFSVASAAARFGNQADPVAGVVDPSAISRLIEALASKFLVLSVSYDQRRAQEVAASAENAGIPTAAVPTTPVRAVPAYGDLYRLIREGRLRHDFSPALTRQVTVATPRQSGDGFVLARPSSGQSITAATATAFAVQEMLAAPPVPTIY